jgi:hypothetical protein
MFLSEEQPLGCRQGGGFAPPRRLLPGPIPPQFCIGNQGETAPAGHTGLLSEAGAGRSIILGLTQIAGRVGPEAQRRGRIETCGGTGLCPAVSIRPPAYPSTRLRTGSTSRFSPNCVTTIYINGKAFVLGPGEKVSGGHFWLRPVFRPQNQR